MNTTVVREPACLFTTHLRKRVVGIPLLLLAAMATAHAQTAPTKQYLQHSQHAGQPTDDGRIHFTGQQITIPVVAVEPGKPDTTFEVHDRVNPTLVVPANTRIQITLVNMDGGMAHGLDVTRRPPPYKAATSLPVAQPNGSVIALTGAVPPHQEDDQRITLKHTDWFKLKPGQYYYACPVPGHAHKGMYGKIIAR